MTPRLSLIMAYYDNPKMLATQYAHWQKLNDTLKDKLEVIIVDDGSPRWPAADVPRPVGLPVLRIYRVGEDKPWHQNAARNIGAFEAKGQWLLLTDMDHMVPEGTFEKSLKGKIQFAYMFDRIDHSTGKQTLDRYGRPKPHPNTFLMTHEKYWKIGGYDERTCGYYGTDSFFRQRIKDNTKILLMPAPVIRFDRKDVDDASTTTLLRKEGRVHGWRHRLQKLMELDPGTRTLQTKWERVV